MRINFDFTDLEAFLAVHEAGSFHLAAQNLGLSQSSVTRRVQKLESALDTMLFDRTTREVLPTLAAKRLRVRADAILNETREATRALRDECTVFAHQRARTLTIATIPTLVSNLIAPAMDRLRDTQPDTRFRILDVAANDVAESVAQGETDFGLCSVPAYEPTTIFECLFVDEMVMAMQPDHPLAAKETVEWADLSGERLILPMRGTGNRMLIDDALARAGLPLVWTLEVGRTSTALDLVRGGAGVAPIPRSAIGTEYDLRILERPIVSPRVSRPIGLLTRAGQTQSALAIEFCDAIRRASQAPEFGNTSRS